MSAQRFKNNELQNRITELVSELEALKEEHRTMKRLHIREGQALKKHENHEVDISKMMKNHQEEQGILKEMNKKLKTENKRINTLLLEREEELRSVKKKNDEMKKIMNDKKLIDSFEISKKLEVAEKDLEEYKQKCEVITDALKENYLVNLSIFESFMTN